MIDCIVMDGYLTDYGYTTTIDDFNEKVRMNVNDEQRPAKSRRRMQKFLFLYPFSHKSGTSKSS